MFYMNFQDILQAVYNYLLTKFKDILQAVHNYFLRRKFMLWGFCCIGIGYGGVVFFFNAYFAIKNAKDVIECKANYWWWKGLCNSVETDFFYLRDVCIRETYMIQLIVFGVFMLYYSRY